MNGYEKTGVLSLNDIRVPSENQLRKGVAIIECVQEIPCNPCAAICPVNAISMKDINSIPIVDFDKCTGCGKCVSICPGLAIFVVKTIDNSKALVTLPYEFLPIPKTGDKVKALNRWGEICGDAEVVRVNMLGKTTVVTIRVDKKLAMEVRNIRV